MLNPVLGDGLKAARLSRRIRCLRIEAERRLARGLNAQLWIMTERLRLRSAVDVIADTPSFRPAVAETQRESQPAALFRVLCYGYVKGIALDPEGWQPLIAARPDWFEVIHLYGTTGSPALLPERAAHRARDRRFS